MQQLIKDLLDLDKRGRDLVQEAEKRKEKLSDEIRRSTQSIKNKLEQRADEHLKKTRDEYDKSAKARLVDTEAEFERRLARMEEVYREHKDEWVDNLVKRCLEIDEA